MAKKIVNVVYKVDDKELAKVKTDLKGIEDATKKSEKGVKELGTQINKVGKEGSQSFLNFKSIVGAISLTALIAGVVTLGKKIFELGVQQEQLNIAFTTFLGSAEKAKKLLAELTKFSIVTPFSPDQVNRAAKSLLAFGVQAQDIIPTLKLIGDVSAGTGKDLAEMAIIFGQIRSTGRLMGQDLLQLINAGFNPLQIISEKTGQSMKSLKEDMENGLISFDMVNDAFKTATSEGGLFFNLMEKQSETVGGKLSTIVGNLEEVGKALFNQTSGPLADFVSGLQSATEDLLLLFETVEQKQQKQEDQIIAMFKASGFTAEKEIQIQEDRIAAINKEAAATGKISEAEFFRILQIQSEIDIIKKYVESQKKKNDSVTQEVGLIDDLQEKMKKLNNEAEKTTSRKRLAEINVELRDMKDQLKELQNLGLGKPILDKILKPILDSSFAKEPIEKFTDFGEGILGLADKQRKKFKEQKDQFDKDDAEDQKQLDDADKQRKMDFAFSLADSLLTIATAQQKEEQNLIDTKYEKELEAAGDNENLKKQIRARQEKEQEQFRIRQKAKDKQNALTAIAIDTAVGIVRALLNPPVPNFFAAGAMAAAGIAQGIVVSRLKEGEININGPGTSTSDSIPAMLSRGESVISADATRGSQNLLEAINDRKIDDRILGRIAGDGGSQAGFDDRRIVNAIERSRVDLAQEGYTLYEHQKTRENFTLKRRKKIHGY